MAATLAQYVSMLTAERIRDSAADATRCAAALRAALPKYSRDRAYKVISAPVLGTDLALLATPTGWEVGFSRLIKIEYPAAETNEQPYYLPKDEAVIEDASDGTQKIRLLSMTMPSSAYYRVVFTKRHTIDDLGDVGGTAATTTTIPSSDDSLFADLAASYLAQMLEAYYATETDSSIGADVTNRKSMAENYSALSDRYLAKYEKALEEDEGSGATAVAFIPWGGKRKRLIFSRVLSESAHTPSVDGYSPWIGR